MEPTESQQQTETDKAAADLAEVDDSLLRISNFKINKMEEISEISRASIATNKSETKMQKKQSLDFSEQLNIDMLIDRILGVLMKTKVEVMELE